MTGYIFELMDMLLSCLHLLILYKCMKAFWGPSWKIFPGCIGWGVYYIFQLFSGLETPMPSQVLLAGNILLVLLVSTLSHYGSLKQRCVFSFLVCTVWMLVEIIVIIIMELLGLSGNELQAAGSIISKMCMLILAVVISRYLQGKLRRDIPVRYFLTILVIPAGSIYLMHHIFLISYQHREYALFAVSASILLLLVNYVIFEVYDWMARVAEIREQNRLYEQQLELCSRQAEERESLYLELRRMRHDMKNHLTGLLGMVQAGGAEEATCYLQELLDDGIAGRPEEVSRSGNIVVDSLVNHKCALARREGIDFEANVFLPISLPFHGGHLAIIFGNILENALEACRDMKDGKGYIRLEASYAKEVLFLTVCNSYKGARKKDRDGRYATTKSDPGRHGLGLASVEQAAACYHGQVEVTDRKGIFQVSVVMYGENGENDMLA
ncbi:sensor histidine kinase [Clostridium sp. Marseille-P2415]|uniref:sensor histidine kinase n=1 Tax=Clostridium sp. Marseille-P2415 TaxID=1805471 RepID=UPI00098885E8|nr:sensor histidine kinase [Clostridium sp. Marseille-P2415]